MSGPKKDKVTLSEQGVVTEEALLAYVQNKLSPEEKQQLEKLLQEDPFAQDALEGLQSSLNQTAVHASISSLNKKVRERSGLKERRRLKLHWVNYAWAAVVFGLLVGIGFVMVNFLNKKDTNLATNNNKENMAAPAMVQKDTVAAEKPKVVAADSTASAKLATDSVAVAATGNTAQSKPAPIAANNLTDKTNNNPLATKPVQRMALQTAGPTGQKQAEFAKSKTDTIKATSANGNKNNLAAAPDNRDVSALQDDAMKSFNSGDYTTAGDDFDKILKHDPDNADALYFGGISDYINGKTAKSETNFDKLLKKGNKYNDGSKWYKANILIKKGHSEAAKPLLQDLSNSNGSYKERAIKKLAEMGF